MACIYLLIGKIQSPRPFPKSLEKGTPNFLNVPSCKLNFYYWWQQKLFLHIRAHMYVGDVFKAVISLYVRDKTSPLPSLEEVLICNHNTTVEEVCNYVDTLCVSICDL